MNKVFAVYLYKDGMRYAVVNEPRKISFEGQLTGLHASAVLEEAITRINDLGERVVGIVPLGQTDQCSQVYYVVTEPSVASKPE